MTSARVSPDRAKQLMDEQDYVYVDVRSVPEFDGGHPEGAYNVPLMHMREGGMLPNEDFMKIMRACFSREAKLVVGCRSGGRSAKAAQLLLDEGYRDVVEQRGGFAGATDAFGRVLETGWQFHGLPVRAIAEPGRSYAELARSSKWIRGEGPKVLPGR